MKAILASVAAALALVACGDDDKQEATTPAVVPVEQAAPATTPAAAPVETAPSATPAATPVAATEEKK